MATLQATDGWKPVRRGTVYCARLCGRGCTHAEYRRACRRADAAAALANDPETGYGGFEAFVFENMGWHSVIRKGALSIHVGAGTGRVVYDAYFNSVHQTLAHGEDLHQVISDAVGAMKSDAEAMLADVEKVRS